LIGVVVKLGYSPRHCLRWLRQDTKLPTRLGFDSFQKSRPWGQLKFLELSIFDLRRADPGRPEARVVSA
jgi:hypothetical protein